MQRLKALEQVQLTDRGLQIFFGVGIWHLRFLCGQN